jgi:RNA polymerase sigma-70 factor (ECF subfamily)
MTADDVLATAYTLARPRLVRIAYAVLGSTAEAEDAVSECWLNLVAADAREPIRDVEAWATVAVAHKALDTLRSARVRREAYVGPWLPEPVLDRFAAADDPADKVTLDDTVSFALMVVLETLTPAERTSWVLHDLFGVEFGEIAEIVGRTPAAVRQLAARARKHVSAGSPRIEVSSAEHQAAVGAFSRAAAVGDLQGLLAVLDPDVTLTSDGGGVVSAARQPVLGADRVARFMLGIAGKLGPDGVVLPVAVNGALGLAVRQGSNLYGVISFTVVAQRITRVDFVVAPPKLAQVPPALWQ